MLVPKVGIEPTLCFQNWILNPARLPVPPLRHSTSEIYQPFVCSSGLQILQVNFSPFNSPSWAGYSEGAQYSHLATGWPAPGKDFCEKISPGSCFEGDGFIRHPELP